MTHDISQLSWTEFEAQAGQTEVGLLPVGAVEVYGPHLPQGTDGIVAYDLCRIVSEQIGCLMAPLVPIGWSESLASFPGTLSVSPDAVKLYCRGVAESLIANGLLNVLIVNSHLGNVPVLDHLCHDLHRQYPASRVAQIDVWRFIQPLTGTMLDSKDWKFGHAGEAMTSVMLYLHPDLVDMNRAARAAPALPAPALGLSYPYSYRELAPKGLLGDATLATAEKGRLIIEAAAAKMVQFIQGPEFAGRRD